MPDNTIFEIKEDKHGKIWFRTITGKTGYIKNDSLFPIRANEIATSFYKQDLAGSLTMGDQDSVIFGRQKRASEINSTLRKKQIQT